jgi:hypothetical protein
MTLPAPVLSYGPTIPATAKSSANAGEARFVGPGVMAELMAEGEHEGMLSVHVEAPGPAQRGRLALVIEAAVETALARRGACAPGVAAATDLALALADQLYRARLLELRGVALGLATLGGLADGEQLLDPEDSAVLRYLITASALHPLRLYLAASDRHLRVFTVPVALAEIMPGASASPLVRLETGMPPSVSPALAQSARVMSAAPPRYADFDEDLLSALTPPPSSLAGIDLTPPSVADFVLSRADALAEVAPEAAAALAPPETTAVPAPSETEELGEPRVVPMPAPLEAEPEPQREAASSSEPAVAAPAAPYFARGPLYESAPREWQTWVGELGTARGPKPLSAIERMFVSAYVPLADAVARGIGDAEARQVLSTWAASFEQSYREAFAALRARGKRPTMVLDLPDVALRIGRLHGARRVELMCVDALRFDLGLRLEQRVRWRMAQEIALTERLLLWSALPTTTSVQLELLGRGPDGLKSWTGEVTSEIAVARGSNARTPRRVKVGHRDLLKLDLVEARLMEPGDHEAARLDELADELAEVVSAQLARLPPRTLAIVFGDHGFRLDALESGTTSGRSGGASPEEVLVPAFAWLVGGVH